MLCITQPIPTMSRGKKAGLYSPTFRELLFAGTGRNLTFRRILLLPDSSDPLLPSILTLSEGATSGDVSQGAERGSAPLGGVDCSDDKETSG